ncbi:hypothetical protein M413DRAFT_30772 [Hebeloma cylindrosporum]|uniref:Uncharacterized protein n=1 Tax=Hebeloma cylindrosporum TaxID=76867 RepID=A0A0C3BZV1_HEBCY|nr:hypothetical protein M413DRAFT_30772 [Hebeloma cylindrosporum h7]
MAASLTCSVAVTTVGKPSARIIPPAQRGTPFSGSANNALDLAGTQTPSTIFTSAHLTGQKASIGPTTKSATIATAGKNPKVPDGYTLVFGPTGGANNAPGFMGAIALPTYDPNLCAQQCNSRKADSNGGACQYFNIWAGVINGTTTGVSRIDHNCAIQCVVVD